MDIARKPHRESGVADPGLQLLDPPIDLSPTGSRYPLEVVGVNRPVAGLRPGSDHAPVDPEAGPAVAGAVEHLPRRLRQVPVALFQPMIVGSSPGSTATHGSTGASGGSSAASQAWPVSSSASNAPQSVSACFVRFIVQPIHHCRSAVVAGPNRCSQRPASSAAAACGSRSPSPPGNHDSASTYR